MSGLAGPAGADPTTAPKLAYLPALDGVRALAVAGVIIYHLDVGIVPGGFLGVDLFFVLSGFLISTLLIREHAINGRIALSQFWLRRARRLLPAVFLMIGVVAIAAAWSSPFDREQLRWDILASVAYVTNWRFILEGQSYFQEFAAPSPVLHLWSLAIEEQFYAVWPLLMVAGLTLASRHQWGRRAVIVALAGGALASAVALALTWSAVDPSVAYYATHTRAHELLVGALAAVLVEGSRAFEGIVRRFGTVLGAAGLAVVLLTMFAWTDATPAYYFGGSFGFSIAAAALIVCLAAPSGRLGPWLKRGFAFQPLPWIGTVSYGLYLWHWPMILWLTPATTGMEGISLAVLRVAASCAAASLSFYLLERPIRRGRIASVRLGVRQVAAGAVAAALVVSGLTIVNTRGAMPLPDFVSGNRRLIISEVPGARGAIGLVGDSVAMSVYPGLAYEAAQMRRNIAAAAFPGCPVGEAVRVDDQGEPFGFADRCPRAVARGHTRMIRDFDPDVVFWLSARDRLPIVRLGEVLAPGSPDWEETAFADWDAVLRRLTARGAHVILILPFHPPGADPAECSGPDALTEECTRPVLSIGALRHQYERWAARHPESVTVFHPDAVLCPESPCPSEVGGIVLRADPVHLTLDGARLLAHELVQGLPGSVWSPSG